ncbi:MAG: GspH/FimT family pseudopilin [Sulfurimicrobium sp.]|nr:GspH/FimT family pseudopilin [Sulfurimicrobium sp.]MDO9190544.1 GspH/FimT family pseudopilin [Sulfurimicrobium sp.]MDP2197623.1 GspH/FimT family pseudopilin [Sulfurimicrobium sp.]MDP3688917.1 GspH/FimT family pseudopilin [Sulfurimicrobium sp.]MDZ7655405.1 GspH/FimT family pseudopilin [Sulfurimicrobium sp.]
MLTSRSPTRRDSLAALGGDVSFSCKDAHSAQKEKGFTLIELMITIAILGLTLALAMPAYTVWIQNTRIRSAAESFVNGLQLARNEGVRRNSTVEFVVGTGSAWTVKCTAVTPGCPDTNAIQNRTIGEGSSSSVTVTPNNGGTIRFDSFGRMIFPVPGAGSTVRFDIDNTLLTAADSRDLRITIDTGGNIRMCDPNVVAPDTRHC